MAFSTKSEKGLDNCRFVEDGDMPAAPTNSPPLLLEEYFNSEDGRFVETSAK
jgi:hypothetical protein